MSFARPELILALLVVGAGAVVAWGLWRRRLAATEAWIAPALWSRLLPAVSRRRIAASVLLLGLAGAAAVLALARPRWGTAEQVVERQGVDVVLVVDTSLSMGATDAAPDRLAVAESLARRLVQELPGNRLALVASEGDGAVLAPLTTDGALLDLLLDSLLPGALPRPGTELATGLRRSARLFPEAHDKHRAVILFSDGEDHGGGLPAAAAELAETGAVVHTVGVGSPAGATVPVPGLAGAVKRHRDGSVVVSRLDEELLEETARAGGGVYLRATGTGTDLDPLLDAIGDIETYALESTSVESLAERFQWPLGVAVALLALHLAWPPLAPRSASRRRPLAPAATVAARSDLAAGRREALG